MRFVLVPYGVDSRVSLCLSRLQYLVFILYVSRLSVGPIFPRRLRALYLSPVAHNFAMAHAVIGSDGRPVSRLADDFGGFSFMVNVFFS